MGGDVPLSSTGSGSSVTVDKKGNVYSAGSFLGIVDFDPGAGTLNLTSKNGVVFICKQDSVGTLLWVKQIGGISSDVANSITIDTSENVYVVGNFQGTVDFDPGSGIFNLTANGGTDIFISKLDPLGNFVWAKNIGGNGPDLGNAIFVDTAGFVYTTGSFQGMVDFDPDNSGIFNLTSFSLNSDIFVSKLDASGNFIWAKQMGGSCCPIAGGNAIAIDALGNVYTTGSFTNTIDFDPGSAPGDTFNLNGGSYKSVFISKLDPSGNFVWAKQLGAVESNSILVDASGNIYTCGTFQGTGDFDPNSVTTYNLTSPPFGNAYFVCKLNSYGNFVWAKQINNNSYYYSDYHIAANTDGHIYGAGTFIGTVDFDPGSGVFNLTSFGNSVDIFISKLDTAGDFVWAKQIGGSNNLDDANSITVNNFGNIFITGNFQATTDFDPSSGIYNLTSGSNHPEIFVSKLDLSGNFVWAEQMQNHIDGSPLGDAGKCIAIHTSGNVYSTGYFNATVDFDPGNGVYNLTSAGNNDLYMSKLDAFGNFLWAKQISSTLPHEATSIAVDKIGNAYITGIFQGTVDFDPGNGTFNLTSAGSDDIFVCKLNASGDFLWAKQIGDISSDMSKSIAVDASGNAYTTGYFQGTLDFDPGSGTFNLNSAGNTDIFISKLDSNGNFVWAKSIGGNKSDVSNSITVDTSGNIYSTGSFWGTVDFDPSSAIFNLVATGSYNSLENKRDSTDIFISKLDSTGNFVWALNVHGINWSDYAYSIKTDAKEYVYITGIAIYYVGSADVFPATIVSKIDSAGNVVWTKIGGAQMYPNTLSFYSIAVDSSGNVFVAGTGGNLNNPDAVVNEYDPSGTLVWTKTMGGSLSDKGNSMTLDACGNIYTTGSFQGTADFDPGSATYNLTTATGATEIFIAKWGNCNAPTHIGDISIQKIIEVYPNPTTGKFAIESGEMNSKLEIYNMLGEKVYSVIPQTNYSNIDLSGQQNGIYFLYVKTENGARARKLILQK